ncbi:MAG: hypothetical protein Q7U66_01955 [Methylobacter sp.]|nr:hypothetical protein [Methylobacter sp.]
MELIENSMNTDTLTIRVECYARYRGEETPRRFFGDKPIEIEEVIDRFLEKSPYY